MKGAILPVPSSEGQIDGIGDHEWADWPGCGPQLHTVEQPVGGNVLVTRPRRAVDQIFRLHAALGEWPPA